MNPFKIKREHGFTVLEVVFALSILAIGIMGYTILKSSSRHSRVYSKNLSQAIQVTASELEVLMQRGYHDGQMADTTGGADHVFGGTLARGDFTADNAFWSVREGCPSAQTKLVNYTTEWSNQSKRMDITQVQVRP